MAYLDITPKKYNLFENVIGDDWRIPIPVKQSDRVTAWDFEGWEGFARVRFKSKDGSIVATFDTYDGTMLLQAGYIYLIADKDVTAQFTAGTYVWDCTFLEPVLGLTRTLIIESIFEIINKL